MYGADERVDMTFDGFGNTYDEELQQAIGGIGDIDLYTEAKARELVRAAEREVGNTSELSVLDVGCGPGLTDAFLTDRFKLVTGVDVSERMIDRARMANAKARYELYDGSRLPFADGSFDVVFAICVLHHVDPEDRRAFAAEMVRVTRPGGLIALQEHNPLNPLTRRIVSRCAFDDGVVLLGVREAGRLLVESGAVSVAHRYILFFPWHGELFRQTERFLGPVPLGAQYMVAGRRP